MKIALSRKNLWEKTPLFLKATLGRALGLVPPCYLLGTKFRANSRFVQESQWWSAELSQEYQLTKLREITKLAYEKTGFYHKIFDSVGFKLNDFDSLEYLRKLPTINKQTIVDNLSDMCTKNIEESDVDYVSTGGTSGTPLHFYINAGRSAIEYAYLVKSWERINYKLGMPMAVLRGRMVKTDKNDLYHEYDPVLKHHYYSNFHTESENLKRYLAHIRRIGDCMFHAYPSSAQMLAKFIIGKGEESPLNIKGVILESENVFPDQVDVIEKAFGVRTFSSYGHSEKCVFAAQCEHSKNYHVWPTYGYFELLDKNDNPINTPGQEGEIVGTGFINTVVPFIRYRTGDFATYVGDKCEACGRQHILIDNIKGRWPQGGLIAADGSIISTTSMNVHDDTFENIREYQFYQSVPGQATLYIVPINTIGKSQVQQIQDNMNKKLQGQVVFEIEVKEELVKTALGKQPRIIQECNIGESN